MKPLNPTLLQINTRILLRELSEDTKTEITLGNIPDNVFENITKYNFNYVWFLGVWQTGEKSREVSRKNTMWLDEMKKDLPDITIDDITGSPYAIKQYKVHSDFGEETDLKRLKEQCHKHNLKLILDFVPNHVSLDHPWIEEHPEFFVYGSESDFQNNPHKYFKTEKGTIFAHGKDPNYAEGWPDTAQLNYQNADLQDAMEKLLLEISSLCDGVRCDMSMLVIPNVFISTWGVVGDHYQSRETRPSFWTRVIPIVLKENENFIFMAEVYWDLEWELQQHGFHYTYDKRLYDRLVARDTPGINGHLRADHDFMHKSVRFLENHDEPRVASVFPDENRHMASAVITYCVPGMHFVHQGQFEGFKIKVSMHIGRRIREGVNEKIHQFYEDFFSNVMIRDEVKNGNFHLLPANPAWDGNPTNNNFVSFTLNHKNKWLLIVVNYGETQGQCYVNLQDNRTFIDFMKKTKEVVLKDLMHPDVSYLRISEELESKGLYLDSPSWGYHIFEVTAKEDK